MVAGSLQKKNDMFYIVLTYNDLNGRRKTKWIKTGLRVRGNKSKAEEILIYYRENFDTRLGCVPSEHIQTSVEQKNNSTDILFGDYLKEWLEEEKSTIELSTYAGYKTNVERIIAPYFDSRGVTLGTLNAHLIDQFYNERLKKVSANTVIHYHAVIRKALQDAYRNDLVPCNYADKAHRPKKGEFISNYYNRDELMILFDTVKGEPIEFAVLMAGYYGLRRSEVVGLKWSNIDLEYKTITIKHTVTTCTIDGKFITIAKDRAKTKKSIRTLPLIPPIYDLLMRMKKKEEIDKEFFGSDYCMKYEGYIYIKIHEGFW